MHVIVITTFFPNAEDPHRTVFIRNLVTSLHEYVGVTIIAPIPNYFGLQKLWSRKHRKIPNYEQLDGLDVYHPNFFVFPKLEFLSGVSYAVSLLPILFSLKKRLKTKLVMHAHRVYPDGMGAALLARLFGLPLVVTAHGSDINRTAKRIGMKFQVKCTLSWADAVITVSRVLQQDVENMVDININVIPCAGYNPLVFNSFHINERLHESNGRTVVYVGALLRLKGVDDLLNAWKLLLQRGLLDAQDRLIFIGNGNRVHNLEIKIESEGLSHQVLLAGGLVQQEVAKWIKSAHLLCLPSYMEGFPNVIVESLACGIPVVSTNVGGIPEIIEEGKNGFLVAPGDIEVLASSIIKALKNKWDKDVMTESVSGLTWDALAKRNFNVLKDAVKSHRF